MMTYIFPDICFTNVVKEGLEMIFAQLHFSTSFMGLNVLFRLFPYFTKVHEQKGSQFSPQ